jgi:hypothetical protein
MKKNSITIVGKVAHEDYRIEIEEFFDDPFMEACTRVVDIKRTFNKHFSVPPFMMAYLDRKNPKLHTYNTYIVLINAGLHKFAETLRIKFKQHSGVDLKLEPIKSKG